MKSVKEKLAESAPDNVAEFEKGAAAFAKKLVANFKDYEFVSITTNTQSSFLMLLQYTSESMNPDGMVALLNYREDGVTRKFLILSCQSGIWIPHSHIYSLLHFLETWN